MLRTYGVDVPLRNERWIAQKKRKKKKLDGNYGRGETCCAMVLFFFSSFLIFFFLNFRKEEVLNESIKVVIRCFVYGLQIFFFIYFRKKFQRLFNFSILNLFLKKTRTNQIKLIKK